MNSLIKLIILIGVLLSMKSMASSDLCQETFSSDKENHYYVGISDGEHSLEVAKEKAYNNAVAEAIKHNFPFQLQINQSVFESSYGTDFTNSSSSNLPKINTNGISTVDMYSTKDGGAYLVCVKIRYSIAAIKKAKTTLKMGTSKLNQYGYKGHLGSLIVKTTPESSSVELVSREMNFSISGTGPAEMHAPLGKYMLTVSAYGYNSYQRPITITGKKQEHYAILKKATARLELNISPKDAVVSLNGGAVKDRDLVLLTDREYTVHVSHPDYHDQTHTVSLSGNNNQFLDINLRGKNGTIVIRTTPEMAKVSINGDMKGRVSGRKLTLVPGTHTVEVTYPGFTSEMKHVTILPNRANPSQSITLTMAPEESTHSWERGEKRSEEKRELQKYVLSYAPLRYDSIQKEYLPEFSFGLEAFLYKYLSVNYEFTRQIWKKKDYTSGIEYDYGSSFQSIGARLYLYRGKYFSIGGGYEHHVYSITKNWNENYQEQSETTTVKGNGYNGVVNFPIFRSDTSTLSADIQMTYREFTMAGKRRQQGSIGITIGF